MSVVCCHLPWRHGREEPAEAILFNGPGLCNGWHEKKASELETDARTKTSKSSSLYPLDVLYGSEREPARSL